MLLPASILPLTSLLCCWCSAMFLYFVFCRFCFFVFFFFFFQAEDGIRDIGVTGVQTCALPIFAPAFLLFGAMFSAIDLSTVAFATDLGHRPVAGLILGTYAFGSAVGGLWYGSRHWTAPLGRRVTTTAALTVAGVSAFWALPGMLVLASVGVIAGLASRGGRRGDEGRGGRPADQDDRHRQLVHPSGQHGWSPAKPGRAHGHQVRRHGGRARDGRSRLSALPAERSALLPRPVAHQYGRHSGSDRRRRHSDGYARHRAGQWQHGRAGRWPRDGARRRQHRDVLGR